MELQVGGCDEVFLTHGQADDGAAVDDGLRVALGGHPRGLLKEDGGVAGPDLLVDLRSAVRGDGAAGRFVEEVELHGAGGEHRNAGEEVVIATGDNNHALVSIMAARAGKDVFCEKPMSLTVAESRAVADTMRRMGRVYQLGTQRRNVEHFRVAVELARSGRLGRLTALHAEQYRSWQTLNEDVLPAQPEPPPEQLNWDLWLGPASWRPFNQTYIARRFWGGHVDFGGGAIPEWGSHTVDICQWAKDADHTGPVSFAAEGDRYVGQYADGTKLIIRTGLRFGTCPVRFEGEEGWVETGDNGQIEASPRSLLEDRSFRGGYPVDGHGREFLNCVRSRRITASNAETGHRSNSACQVANICKRLQRPVRWDPENELFIDDVEANRMLSRAFRAPFFM